MKLKNIRVRMFRNILDSGDVSVQPDVTCLVGKNESGKTAFLQALWRLNPARTKPTFSIPDHYPAWLEKRHRVDGIDVDDVEPIDVVYSWDQRDRDLIEKKFGKNVAPTERDITISKTYKNEIRWRHHRDEKSALKNLLSSQTLPKEISDSCRAAKTFEDLRATIVAAKKAHADNQKVVAALQSLETLVKEKVGDKDFGTALWSLLAARLPAYFYFADYSKLPDTAKIDRI